MKCGVSGFFYIKERQLVLGIRSEHREPCNGAAHLCPAKSMAVMFILLILFLNPTISLSRSRSPSPAGHSGGSATEHEDHSGSEKHSDANETDAEKSPRPVRKPTPKPNGKEQPKSDKSSGESGSDKESDD
ncbi:hypothetical protein OSTOST_17168 [Ostertagia ostertagi]